MANKKHEVNTNETSYQDTDLNYEATSTAMPPPYEDEPPAYSSLVDNNHVIYASAPTSIDLMEKLPFEDPSPHSYYRQPPPVQAQPNFAPYVNSQVTIQQTSLNFPPNGLHHNQHSSMPTAAPHKILLQPTPSRVVETMAVGRRKTVSHVTDLESGKEYFIKERTSRSGLRSKAIIKEVGGPKTCVKETPKRTVVRQKR